MTGKELAGHITGSTGVQITLFFAALAVVAGISYQGGRLTNRVDANEARIGELTEIVSELAASSKRQPVNHIQTIRLDTSNLNDIAREILKARGELPK